MDNNTPQQPPGGDTPQSTTTPSYNPEQGYGAPDSTSQPSAAPDPTPTPSSAPPQTAAPVTSRPLPSQLGGQAAATPSEPHPAAQGAPIRQGTTARKPTMSDEIDYAVYGDDMQCVEITLDPGEVVISEPSAMMYMEQGIQMSTKMTDGSQQHSGLLGRVAGAAKRYMSGETLWMTFFTNNGNTRSKVAFNAPYPGEIIPLDLGQLGTVMCQKDGFLCGARGVSVGVGFTKRIGAGMFGGEGYVLQKLQGDGMAFIHAGGCVIEKELRPGEILYVDSGSVVGFQASIDFNIKMVTGTVNMLFGGEDLFLSTLQGPGKVWIQSMPYFRLAQHLRHTMTSMTSHAEKRKSKKQ